MADDAAAIIESIQQYWPSFPITQQQLEHPTSEFVIEFYQMFETTIKDILCHMTSCDDKTLDQQTIVNETPFSLLVYVNKYLKSLTNPEIELTLTDLYEPTAKRTKIRFKILLSILSIYENQITRFRDTIRNRLCQTHEHANKRNDKEKLKEELARKAEQLARMEDKINKSQKKLQNANLRHESLQLHKANNDRKLAKLQLDVDALMKTAENKETLLTNVKANIHHLNEQVVTIDSYKSMLDLKENLVQKNTDLDEEIDCFAKSLADKKPAVERFENLVKLKQELTTDCEKLMFIQDSISVKKAEIKDKYQSYQRKLEIVTELNENKLKSKKHIEVIKEAIDTNVSTFNSDIAKIQKENEEIKFKFIKEEKLQMNMENERELIVKRNEVLKKECDQITTNIKELNTLYDNTYKKILGIENELTDNINETLLSASLKLKRSV